MATSRSSPHVCARFGQFHADLSSRELLRTGERVAIQEKPFLLLRLLLEAEGQVVTREQVRTALWPEDTFVDFEHGVNTAVKKVRQALDDSAERPEYVETLPRLGYRFMIPVEWEEDGSRPDGNRANVVTMAAPERTPLPHLVENPVPQIRRWKLKTALALAGLAIVAAVLLLYEETDTAFHLPRASVLHRLGIGGGMPPLLLSRRLTANPEDTPLTSGVISPDGKYLVYTDSTGFYLRLVDTGETHPVPLPQGFDASVESWFPDSIHLVVSWVEDSKRPPSLWEISVLGGTPRKLADEGSFARVAPDAMHIAFSKGPWDDNEIWLMDATGNGARKVIDGGLDGFGPVAWKPDGKRFAYVRGSPERPANQIETYDLSSGHGETILSGDGLGLQILWLPSGRLIYSLPEPQPNQGDANLWWVQLNGPDDRLSSPPARITNDRDGIASISVTSDGKRLALLRCSTQADVYLAELEAQGRKLSPPRRFTLDERQDFPASWTPDSKAVLVVSDRDGPSHIFKQIIDQTQPELMVGGKQDVWLPHVTPDGRSMLYLSSPAQVGPSDNVRLMRMSLSGGPSHSILEEPGIVNYQCARLPSSVCVYGRIDSEYYRFFSFDASDGKRTELVPARLKKEAGLNNWNLSPDGRYLAMCTSQNPYAKTELRVFSLADNTERHLAITVVKLIMGIDWAADSKSVWVGGYMGRGSWGTRSGLINVDLGGHVRTLIEGHSPQIMGGTPSPDGHRLAIGANTFSSNVWLAEHF